MIRYVESASNEFARYLTKNGVENAEYYVKNFELLKKNQRIRSIEDRDYFTWLGRSPSSFLDFVDSFKVSKTKAREAEIVYGSEIVYEDEYWTVYLIKTVEASRRLGAGTKWCISGRGAAEAFADYKRYVTIYFYVSKIETKTTCPKFYKIAAIIGKVSSDSGSYFSADDKLYYKRELYEELEAENLISKTYNIFEKFKIDYETLIDESVLKSVNRKDIKDGTFVIPEGIKEIGFRAFENIQELRRIIIPDSVKLIGFDAFRWCNSLEEVIIPDSVIRISSSAFCGCSSLERIVIPKSVREIGELAFEDCRSLKDVIFEGDPSSIKLGKSVFDNTPVFSKFKHLEQNTERVVHVFESVSSNFIDFLEKENIGDATSLVKRFELLKQNGRISDTKQRDFYYWSLRDPKEFIEFVDSFKVSKTKAKKAAIVDGSEIVFENDEWTVYLIKTVDASIILGNGTKWCISGDEAEEHFQYYDDYVTIYFFISKTLTYNTNSKYYKIAGIVGRDYEDGSYFDAEDKEHSKEDLEDILPEYEIKCNKEPIYIYEYTLVQIPAKDVIRGVYKVPENIIVIDSFVTYEADKTTELIEIVLPNSVRSIENSAFENSNIKKINLPYRLENISFNAFKNSSIQEIKIPDRIKYIYPSVFEGSKICKIFISKNVSEIYHHAFYGCKELIIVEFEEGSALKKIGQYAFAGCTNLHIKIPSSVTDIERYAFESCNLKNITFESNANKIEIVN